MALGSRPRAALNAVSPTALVATLLMLVTGAVASLPTATAAGPGTITLVAPAQYADRSATLTVTLADGGVPIADADVLVERRAGSGWASVGSATTDASGRAVLLLSVARVASANDVRATYTSPEGVAQATYRLPLRAYTTATTISGRHRVRDEGRVRLRLVRRTTTGVPVPGTILLQRRVAGRWRTVLTRTVNAEGYVDVLVRPRSDVRYRAVGVGQAWAARSISAAHWIDNLPPGVPARLPAAAPRPRITLPAQPRGVGVGANPVITRISDGVWRSMVGRSWHQGCPVGRSELRLLRINYWDYTGYRRRGELVAATGAIDNMAAAFVDMYQARLPIRAMYRVDRFGWSDRRQGADDDRSMAAGNTSAFNCRWVVGRSGVRSPHAYGRALDLNTWENPFRASFGYTPNAWWVGRSNPRVAWRSTEHPVVRIMARHLLRWTYGLGDMQHFDVVAGAREIPVPDCGLPVCE